MSRIKGDRHPLVSLGLFGHFDHLLGEHSVYIHLPFQARLQCSGEDAHGVRDYIHTTVAELRAKGIEFAGEPKGEGYGITIMMTLPGGVQVQLYEPRHAMAITPTAQGRA